MERSVIRYFLNTSSVEHFPISSRITEVSCWKLWFAVTRDFGLAKEKGLKEGEKKLECIGTPIFMVSESINGSVYESPMDIWALSCAFMEMISGKPTWNMSSKKICDH
ncbi:hypothetical protein KIW84_061860 [Lathyrus oleraceus]|uniref:Protein kinase domain-containing protein n=1 Tax=Pisum sativum TaxID=3888 RepID=A0A9D5A4R5_PEA|nr:hypothetical protein KIW84_061860 [Pisum sativum]